MELKVYKFLCNDKSLFCVLGYIRKRIEMGREGSRFRAASIFRLYFGKRSWVKSTENHHDNTEFILAVNIIASFVGAFQYTTYAIQFMIEEMGREPDIPDPATSSFIV